LTVTLDPALLRQRLAGRDRLTPAEMQARIECPLAAGGKSRRADLSSTTPAFAETRRQVAALYQHLRSLPPR